MPVVTRLEERGWPPLAATWGVVLSFLLVVAGVLALIVPATVAESDQLGDAVSDGLDEVERWLVEGPLDLDRGDVEELRDGAGGSLADLVRSSSSTIVDGVRIVGETVAGALLAVVLGFLLINDGRRFQGSALEHLPRRHHELARVLAARAWDALGGYLRGAAVLGAVEGTVIGLTVWAVGAPLAGPVAVLTFVAAFFPIVGAVVAGAAATLVALAGGGVSEALVVLAVCVVVQQFDNDLLAPVVYGRALRVHPAVVLVALTAGATLGGIAGALLAVPFVGAVSAVANELWGRYVQQWVEGSPPEPATGAPGRDGAGPLPDREGTGS